MTLRISIVEDHGAFIQLDGRLTGEEVGELDRATREHPGWKWLELGNLRSADAAGLAALRRLRASGVAMRGLRPHLAWRIDPLRD